MDMGTEKSFGRRSLVALLPIGLAACGASGPPDQGEVRQAVTARLEELRGRFLAGDTRGLPDDVEELMKRGGLSNLTNAVRQAELTYFVAAPFSDAGEGRWKGRVDLRISIPIEDHRNMTHRFRVASETTIALANGRWSFVSFGPLVIERMPGSVRL